MHAQACTHKQKLRACSKRSSFQGILKYFSIPCSFSQSVSQHAWLLYKLKNVLNYFRSNTFGKVKSTTCTFLQRYWKTKFCFKISFAWQVWISNCNFLDEKERFMQQQGNFRSLPCEMFHLPRKNLFYSFGLIHFGSFWIFSQLFTKFGQRYAIVILQFAPGKGSIYCQLLWRSVNSSSNYKFQKRIGWVLTKLHS
jgi:hypothetical protein